MFSFSCKRFKWCICGNYAWHKSITDLWVSIDALLNGSEGKCEVCRLTAWYQVIRSEHVMAGLDSHRNKHDPPTPPTLALIFIRAAALWSLHEAAWCSIEPSWKLCWGFNQVWNPFGGDAYTSVLVLGSKLLIPTLFPAEIFCSLSPFLTAHHTPDARTHTHVRTHLVPVASQSCELLSFNQTYIIMWSLFIWEESKV